MRATIRIAPTSSVSVARALAGSSAPWATLPATSVEAVSTAIVDVVLTESVREPPTSA